MRRAAVETATAASAAVASAAVASAAVASAGLDSQASHLEGRPWEAFRASAFEGRARSQGDNRAASVASAEKTFAEVAVVEQRVQPLASPI